MRELITRSWTGDWVGIYIGVVYGLEDGSKWRVIDDREQLEFGFRRQVTVSRSRGKYRMQPKGDRKSYLVEPLVLPPHDPTPYPKSTKNQLMACLFTDLSREIARHQRSFGSGG